MLVVILQMSTIASLTILVILIHRVERRREICPEESEEKYWIMQTQRIGRAEKTPRHYMRRKNLENRTELAEDGYLVGNAITDDIFLDTSQKKVRMYMNVQKNRIFLTVLKGKVMIQNHVCYANDKKVIEIGDSSGIIVDDIRLRFIKKGMV